MKLGASPHGNGHMPEDWLTEALKRGASDLHLIVGQTPRIRIDGKLAALAEGRVTEEKLERFLRVYGTAEKEKRWRQEVDWTFSFADVRVRGHLFWERSRMGVALRFLPQKVPTVEELQLPPILKELVLHHRGLFLVTGPTGSGKTTTLVSLLQELNRSHSLRIITLEEPVEYLLDSENSLVTQREIGKDTRDWMSGIHAILRQDPDVIMLGELRDAETIRAAVRVAEAGHLVLSTLHASRATDALYRMVNSYSPEQRPFILSQLASLLVGIANQRLIHSKQKNGRIAAFEILVNTRAVAHLIRTGQFHQIDSLIQAGQAYGMQTMEADFRKWGVSGEAWE